MTPCMRFNGTGRLKVSPQCLILKPARISQPTFHLNFPHFESVEDYLNSLINYEQTFPLGGARDRPKLEPTLQAARRLGLPLSLRNCVHIAGTKGKGSVVAFLECLLAPGHTLLSFTSPHLVSVRERVRLNGQTLPDELWQSGFAAMVDALSAAPEIKLTYFESVFVFYLWATQALHSDVQAVEAGLGGMWDATNVLDDTLAVLTRVDYDHTEILGKTLTAISTDKSGIIKHNARVVVARQPQEALEVYRAAIARQEATAQLADADFGWKDEGGGAFRYWDGAGDLPHLELAVTGDHQRDNAAAAIRTALWLFPDLDAAQIRARLSACTVPGRQQLLRGAPDVIVDVAHNPVSFAVLAQTLRRDYAHRSIHAVIGMVKDKDARSSLDALKGIVSNMHIVALTNPRSCRPEELCEIARQLGFAADCSLSLEEAFAALHRADSHDLGLVAGSFYLAGDYLKWRARAGIA
jgi:dihydrofolate synthase/folylpolyglutamate synthase